MGTIFFNSLSGGVALIKSALAPFTMLSMNFSLLKQGLMPKLGWVRFFSVMIAAALTFGVSGIQAATDWLDEEPEFLRVDEAFRLTAELNANRTIVARWQMPLGYYLYQHLQICMSLDLPNSNKLLHNHSSKKLLFCKQL